LAYVGTENAISGWVVSFLLRARHATPAEATLPLTGFWSGMAIGRFVLGAVAERIGVLWATVIYLTCAIGLELLFASIRVSVASIIFMTLLGFSMGPLFPSGIVLLNRLLPKDLHVGAVSFVASVGQIGAAIFPFGIGALVDMTGIGLFQYAIVALTTVTLVLWVLFSSVRPAATVTVSGADTESIGA
jgi:fucose permease